MPKRLRNSDSKKTEDSIVEIEQDKNIKVNNKDNNTSNSSNKEVIIIFDKASLETVKTKSGSYELLNCDDHVNIMKKFDKDPQMYRPDIIHQEIMAALDSPLNKSGHMKIYVHTEANVLIEINPKTRIPRTYKRFSGLMVQLLHRLKIRSADGNDMLLKVVKNPVSGYLPAGSRSFGFSHKGSLFSPTHFASNLPDNAPIVLVFGAMASGSIDVADHPYIEQLVSISEYPLSGVVAVNRVLGAIENHWGIV